MDEGRRTVDEGRRTVDEGRRTVDEGRRTVDEGRRTVDEGRRTVDEGRRTVDEGRRTVDEGRRTVDEGRRTVDEGRRWMETKINGGYYYLHPRPSVLCVFLTYGTRTSEVILRGIESLGNRRECVRLGREKMEIGLVHTIHLHDLNIQEGTD